MKENKKIQIGKVYILTISINGFLIGDPVVVIDNKKDKKHYILVRAENGQKEGPVPYKRLREDKGTVRQKYAKKR